MFIEMIENPSDDLGLGDEGNDDKLATAGTEEWVGLVNPPDQMAQRFLSAARFLEVSSGSSSFASLRFGDVDSNSTPCFFSEPSLSMHMSRSNEYYVYVLGGSV